MTEKQTLFVDTFPMDYEEAMRRAQMVLKAQHGIKTICMDKFRYTPIESREELNKRVKDLIDDTLYWETWSR